MTDLYINQLADGRLMHLNSWIEADGWATDAYMLAVTYHEGDDMTNPGEIFIGHGSALRRGDDVRYSSLSKLNLIARGNGRSLDLNVTGQPRVNLRYKASPASLNVNGKATKIERDGNIIKVKYHE